MSPAKRSLACYALLARQLDKQYARLDREQQVALTDCLQELKDHLEGLLFLLLQEVSKSSKPAVEGSAAGGCSDRNGNGELAQQRELGEPELLYDVSAIAADASLRQPWRRAQEDHPTSAQEERSMLKREEDVQQHPVCAVQELRLEQQAVLRRELHSQEETELMNLLEEGQRLHAHQETCDCREEKRMQHPLHVCEEDDQCVEGVSEEQAFEEGVQQQQRLVRLLLRRIERHVSATEERMQPQAEGGEPLQREQQALLLESLAAQRALLKGMCLHLHEGLRLSVSSISVGNLKQQDVVILEAFVTALHRLVLRCTAAAACLGQKEALPVQATPVVDAAAFLANLQDSETHAEALERERCQPARLSCYPASDAAVMDPPAAAQTSGSALRDLLRFQSDFSASGRDDIPSKYDARVSQDCHSHGDFAIRHSSSPPPAEGGFPDGISAYSGGTPDTREGKPLRGKAQTRLQVGLQQGLPQETLHLESEAAAAFVRSAAPAEQEETPSFPTTSAASSMRCGSRSYSGTASERLLRLPPRKISLGGGGRRAAFAEKPAEGPPPKVTKEVRGRERATSPSGGGGRDFLGITHAPPAASADEEDSSDFSLSGLSSMSSFCPSGDTG
ncbi:hypothetical protein cyc_01644 [Cyclospora cayetanensis]|uniref:Uncharacterized protein n=1 Tax=Cyclospora cayetanensis TaxID=88456 RepID=A0A1D3D242_9EIME|nr:hypothetical protein cyc_01644 [Cyclospora cayetanensis]